MDVAYPEIVATGAPHVRTVTDGVGHQSGPEISSEVDGVASFPAETCTNTEDDEEQRQRYEILRTEIMVVLNRIDEEHEQCAGNNFAEEHAGSRHERRRICAEDPGRRIIGIPWNGANANAAFKLVDCGLVVGVDDEGGTHGS